MSWLASHLHSIDREFRANPFAHPTVDAGRFLAAFDLWKVVTLTVEGFRNFQDFFRAVFPTVSALLASFWNYEYLSHRFGEGRFVDWLANDLASKETLRRLLRASMTHDLPTILGF